jgi:hypothetical protein
MHLETVSFVTSCASAKYLLLAQQKPSLFASAVISLYRIFENRQMSFEYLTVAGIMLKKFGLFSMLGYL